MYVYKILIDNINNISETSLNTMGAEGWELVSVMRVSENDYFYYFKKKTITL